MVEFQIRSRSLRQRGYQSNNKYVIMFVLATHWALDRVTESLVVILFNKHLKNRNDRIQTFTPITLGANL